jgi:hypothetical protein
MSNVSAENDAPGRGFVAWTGYLSLVQALLIIIPTVILGSAIDWPVSLGDPASVMLPRIIEQQSSVQVGYLAYLIYSILFVVLIALLSEIILGNGHRVLKQIIIAMATASTLARSIGIIRWLVPIPELAVRWSTAGDEQQRYAISVMYDLLNAYGGTIGEVLGVSVFAACAIALLAIGGWLRGSAPRWFSLGGLVAVGALLATSSEVIGIDPGSIVPILGTATVQCWFLATGIWLAWRGRAAQQA